MPPNIEPIRFNTPWYSRKPLWWTIGMLTLVIGAALSTQWQRNPLLNTTALAANVVIIHPGHVEIYVSLFQSADPHLMGEALKIAKEKKSPFSDMEDLLQKHAGQPIWKGTFTEWLALRIPPGSYIIMGQNIPDAVTLLGTREITDVKCLWDISSEYIDLKPVP